MRRLVHGVLVNHEFDFLRMRVEDLGDVVDAFIVQERNFRLNLHDVTQGSTHLSATLLQGGVEDLHWMEYVLRRAYRVQFVLLHTGWA